MRPNPADRLPIDRWLLILLIVATFLYSSFSSSLFVSTGALSQADYLLFINQFSIVGTLVSVVAALLVGPLLSRLGYNRVFLLGAALSAIGIGVFLLPLAVPVAVIAQCLLKVGTTLITFSSTLYLVIHGRRRLMVWLPIAGIAGDWSSQLLIDFADRVTSRGQETTGLFSLLTLGATLIFAIFALTRLRWRTAMPTGEAIWYYTPLQILRDSRTWSLLGLMTAIAILIIAIGNSFPLLVLEGVVSPSMQSLRIWVPFGSAVSVIALAIWGWLAGRLAAAHLLVAGLGGALVGTVLLWFFPNPYTVAVSSFSTRSLGSLLILYMLDRAGINHLPAQTVMNTLMTSDIFTRPLSPLVIMVTLLVLLAGGALWWSQREAITVKNSVAVNEPDDFDSMVDYLVEAFPTTRDGKQNYGSPEQNP
mgnify:CR=1 FL=1